MKKRRENNQKQLYFGRCTANSSLIYARQLVTFGVQMTEQTENE